MINPITQFIPITPSPDSDASQAGIGPLSSLENSGYDFSTTRYPLEGLGSDDVLHYVIFNINLPETSKYIKSGGKIVEAPIASQENYDVSLKNGGKYNPSLASGTKAAAAAYTIGGLSDAFTGSSGNEFGFFGRLFGGGIAPAASTAAVLTLGNNLTLKPKLKRIAKSIAIYMPDTILTQYDHGYNEVSVTEALADAGLYSAIGDSNIVGSIIDSGSNIIKGRGVKYNDAQSADAAGIIGEKLGAGPGFRDLTLKSVGRAVNPQVELVFKGTSNRGYVFVFDFQPRSAKEASAIQDIIKTFKMFAAPETTTEGAGRYFIPPGQFDINYYYKNVENEYIAKISSCVLTNIAVNYSASGAFATFDDGFPVHINLQLTFKEIDIITREMIQKFGY